MIFKNDKVKKYKFIVPVLFVLGAVFLIFAMYQIFLFMSDKKEELSHNSLNTATKLEEAYDAGEYEKVADIYDMESDSTNNQYDKYKEVAELHQSYEDACEEIESQKNDAITLENPNELDSLEELFALLKKCEALEAEGFKSGEEDAVKHYKELTVERLENNFRLTTVEIEEVLRTWTEEKDMSEVYEIVYQRLMAQE